MSMPTPFQLPGEKASGLAGKQKKGNTMTKKLMLLAAGALTALAFAALPAGASALEVEAHCSSAPCEGLVESTGHAVLSEDSGTQITCAKTTGTVTQKTATSSTVEVDLTFDECTLQCHNEGTPTFNNKIQLQPTPVIGHLIKQNNTVQILLTNIDTSFECVILGIKVTKTVTGNVIGTITNPECGKAVTHHTISFTQTSAGQQTHKTYTAGTFDLLSNNTTASQTGEAHIKYGEKTVTLTC